MAGTKKWPPTILQRRDPDLPRWRSRPARRCQSRCSTAGSWSATASIWEGVRLHHGKLAFLIRISTGCSRVLRAIDLDIGLDRNGVAEALYQTCEANGMTDGVHIRLMITRGLKKTPNQDPRQAIGRPTVVIVAEYKQPNPALMQTGLKLLTSTFRCTRPDQFDMRLNSHSRLNLIGALIQAYKVGADEALMLDTDGFVSSCNATNFFFVRKGEVLTSTGRSCFNGITRTNIIELCRAHDIPVRLDDFTLTEVYSADEAFVTGTFAGVTPVREIDGRRIGESLPGPVTTPTRPSLRRADRIPLCWIVQIVEP